MGAFDGLKRKLEEARAQFNVFDGGKSAATVRRGREIQAAQQREKPFAQLNARRGSMSPQQYQAEFSQLLRQNPNINKSAANSRSSVEQALFPAIGSATRMAASIPADIGTFVGNTLQDPVGVARQVKNLNPLQIQKNLLYGGAQKLGIKLPDAQRAIDDRVQGYQTRITNNIVGKQNMDKAARVGSSLENISARNANNIRQNIENSRFQTQARPGENRFVTNLSNAGGSLATSLALRKLPGGSVTPAALFGLNSGGQQTRDARSEGLTPAQAVQRGTIAGVAEAGLEKAGLDTFVKNFGGSSIVKNALRNALTEGLQEFSQSLAGSGVRGSYTDVNPVEAIKQAGVEGFYGALIGGGATSVGNISQKLQKQGIPKIDADKIAKDVVQKLKESTALPNTVQLSRNELDTLKDFTDYRTGVYKPDIKTLNQLFADVYRIGDKIGLDTKTGSDNEQIRRISDWIEQYELRQKAPRQGGFIGDGENLGQNQPNTPPKLPQSKSALEAIQQSVSSSQSIDPLESLKQEARKYKSVDGLTIQKTKDLKLSAGNTRPQVDAGFVDEIKQNGVVPVVVDKNGNVLDGEHRIAALEKLGVDNVPVIRLNKSNMELNEADMMRINELQQEGKTMQLTDLYNQAVGSKATAPKTVEKPTGKAMSVENSDKFKNIKDQQMMEKALRQDYDRAKNAISISNKELQSVRNTANEYIDKLKNTKNIQEAKKLNKEFMDITAKYEDGSRVITQEFNDIVNAVDDAYMNARKSGKAMSVDPLESLKQEASDYSVKMSSRGNIYIKKANGEVVTQIPKTIQGDLYAKAQGEILTPDRARKLDDWITKNTQATAPKTVEKPTGIKAVRTSADQTTPQPALKLPKQQTAQKPALQTARSSRQSVGIPLKAQNPQSSSQIEISSDGTSPLQKVISTKETQIPQLSVKTTPVRKTKLQTKLEQAPTTTQISDQKPSQNTSSSISNYTPAVQSEKDWGSLMLQVDTEMPSFNAVAGSKNSNSGNKLIDAIQKDKAITRALNEAQNNGKEINFFAAKSKDGRKVALEQYNPSLHRVEAGFVVDQDGNVLGNHVKVDSSGVQINIGGELVNMESVLGDITKWGGKYKVSETLNQNIDRNAPTKEIAENTKKWLWTSKVKAEANYRTELQKEFETLKTNIDVVESARPRNVSKDQFNDDIFSVLNGDKTDADIQKVYEAPVAQTILDYRNKTRVLYDSLLQRINAERVKIGQAPVKPRKDYVTHIVEMNNDTSFAGQIYQDIRNSFTDEGNQKTRNGVPANIAGRTEDFKPTSAYNKFLQRRTGTESERDPFKAVQAYLEPALYNIHMTEATARARAVETAFRTAGELQQMQPDQVLKEANKLLNKYRGGASGELVTMFQEYANTLARKSNRFDRPAIDTTGTRQVVRGSQLLQRVGGRGTILGNVSSMLAQPLNQVVGIADAGPINYLKGIAASIGNDSAIERSPFIKARRTKATAPIRSNFDKTLELGGVPLQKFEMASIEIVWNSQHSKAKAQGLNGQAAIDKADMETERLVAGRGIGDRPEAYRSVLANNALQYTLEVNAQYRAFNKMSVSQKATFLVAASAMNALMGAITGFTPLPDFLKAAFDTGADFLDEEDERGAWDKTVQGFQRAAGEYTSMNPFATVAANTLLSQDQRSKLFGGDSQVGMFEGTAAPVQVVRNVFDTVDQARQGNWQTARNSALKTVPFGNQIQKTWSGLETLQRGYAVNRSGEPTFAAPDSLYGKAQTLVFGPNSTANARNYYDNDQTSITGKSDTASIEKSSDKRATVEQIQSRRALEKSTGEKNGEFMGVSDRNGLLQAYRDGAELSDVQKRVAKALDEMPQGLSSEAQDELVREAGFNADTKKKYYNKIENKLELELATLERDMAKGVITKTDAFKRQKDIQKLSLAQNYGQDVYEMYGLAVYEIENIADQETYNKLLAYDRELYNAGLISKPKFKENGKGKGGRTGTKTALKSAISFATADTPNLPSIKLSGIRAPQKRLNVPSVRVAANPRGKQYSFAVKKLA